MNNIINITNDEIRSMTSLRLYDDSDGGVIAQGPGDSELMVFVDESTTGGYEPRLYFLVFAQDYDGTCAEGALNNLFDLQTVLNLYEVHVKSGKVRLNDYINVAERIGNDFE